jgi:hypothetical protein
MGLDNDRNIIKPNPLGLSTSYPQLTIEVEISEKVHRAADVFTDVSHIH